MVETGAIKQRDVRLVVRRIRYGASHDRLGDRGCCVFGFAAPQKHLAVHVTVTSTPTNSRLVGAPPPLPLALGAP
jgi:hypothetical protein